MKKKVIISAVIIAIIGLVGAIILKNKSNNTLVEQTTYNYPYKEVLKIEKNGKIYKSKIIDELTAEGELPKNQFTYIKRMKSEDLKEIKNILNQMKKEEKKKMNYSESYGIVVNLDGNCLSGCEYYNQEEVNKLNQIIEKYK